jgi:hypothetical protein
MAWVVTYSGSWDFAPVTIVTAAVIGIMLMLLLRRIGGR